MIMCITRLKSDLAKAVEGLEEWGDARSGEIKWGRLAEAEHNLIRILFHIKR